MAPKQLLLKTPWQIRIVMHPKRVEILERLQTDGQDSIAGLAAKLDCAANALTYHVRLLEKAGAIVAHGKRRVGRRHEVIYAPAAERIAIGVDPRSPGAMRAATHSATAVCRLMDREIRRALSSGMVHGGVPLGRRHRAWLTDEDAAAVHQKLAAIERLLTKAQRRKQGRPYAFTAFLVPLATERKG
jgi:DNA-binding transcriptional ArsR family regulator